MSERPVDRGSSASGYDPAIGGRLLYGRIGDARGTEQPEERVSGADVSGADKDVGPAAAEIPPRRATAKLDRIGRFRLLSGERVIETLTIDDLTLTLTDRRVLVSGEEKRLWFFAGSTTSRSALASDVTVASAESRFLPSWLAVSGAGLALYALVQGLRDNMLALVIGVAALAAWYFVRTDVLELSVEGRPLVVVPTRTAAADTARNMDAFVEALFEIKATEKRASR